MLPPSSPFSSPSFPTSLCVSDKLVTIAIVNYNPIVSHSVLLVAVFESYDDARSLRCYLSYNIRIMRFSWSLVAIAVSVRSVSAFAPAQSGVVARSSALNQVVAAGEVKAKQDATLEKLKAKDAGSSAISGDVSLYGSRGLVWVCQKN